MNYPIQKISVSVFAILLALCSCSSDKQKTENKSPVIAETPATAPGITPVFNGDSAYAYVSNQCAFGPRVPNTKAHDECAAYLIRTLKTYTEHVIVQEGSVTTFDHVKLKIKNIITSFNPESKTRILLFAHWDSRPWADQDTVRPREPVMGADDGGSGVAVLVEIARQLSTNPPPIGVDLAMFDAEDWGQLGGGREAEDSYALGTQFWTKNPHVPGYSAKFGILLDMVGAKNATFRMEGSSKEYAAIILDQVWKTANRIGYSDYFLFQDFGWVTDDHVYVNKAGIPSIDIINSDPLTPTGFAHHWHKHSDNMDIIDRRTLKAVGQTLLEVIFSNNGI